jgi:hypothetical protein
MGAHNIEVVVACDDACVAAAVDSLSATPVFVRVRGEQLMMVQRQV